MDEKQLAEVGKLKARVPTAEHDAFDSRLEELLNDSSADEDDVVAILRQEFGSEG
ncbi:MAG: hypothetical protein M3O20_04925 [Acidobacteriota bacterium]|nr:hypothetical protein [Acidobacteriota bacterium]